MNKLFLTTVLFLCCCSLCLGQRNHSSQISDTEKVLKSMHRNITSEKLYGYVKHLSDSTIFQGRLAGSPGMERAVKWAQNLFQEWGLEVLPGAPGYIQEYPHPCVEVGYGSYMKILFPVEKTGKPKGKEPVYLEKSYPWADGWFAGGTSGNGEVTADVVYVGYGVTAPELGYDDYAGIDVKGKIVLMEGETPNTSRNTDTLNMWYPYTLHQHKVENAAKHGAAGMLYKWVPGPNNAYVPGFVYAYITQPVMNDLFLGTGKDYRETVRKIKKEKKPASFATGKRATIKMNTTYNPNATGKNVIGYIKGSDPVLCNEYIIVSGHLDHLGMIPYHIAGANDNNSATATLMGAAEALAKSGVRPKRSIIFMNLDGEEAGLTGSTYYTKNPLVPKEKVKLIINLEQCGIGDNISVTAGYETPDILNYFKQANNQYVHRPLSTGTSRHVTRPRTDGAVFMKAGYPAGDLGTWGGAPSYYHHPKDDWNTINGETLEDAAKLVLWTAITAANAE